MNNLIRPMPKPTAQVEPYVKVFGADLTVTFLLQFGGSELYIADNPKNRSALVALVGHDKARELAEIAYLLPKRVPLASNWLARMLDWQGFSHAAIARTLRITDVTVRKYLNGGR